MDLKEIRERWPDIMPSERTLQKWRKKGFGNAGIPWDDARLRVVSRIESATTAATIEELKADAREALHLLMERFREGRGGARFADLPAIAEFLLKLESLDQSKIDFMKTFVREAARILASTSTTRWCSAGWRRNSMRWLRGWLRTCFTLTR